MAFQHLADHHGSDSVVYSGTNRQTVKISHPLKTLNTDALFLGAGSQHECYKCLTTYSYVWRKIGDEGMETCNACFLDVDFLACPFCASRTAADGGVMRSCINCHRLFHRSCELKFRKQANADGLCVVCEVGKMLHQRKLRTKNTHRTLQPILNHHIFEFTNYFLGTHHQKQREINFSVKTNSRLQMAAQGTQLYPFERYFSVMKGTIGGTAESSVSLDARPTYCVLSGRSAGFKVDCWRYPDLLRASPRGKCIRIFSKSEILVQTPFHKKRSLFSKSNIDSWKVASVPGDNISNSYLYQSAGTIGENPHVGFHTNRNTRTQNEEMPILEDSSERQAYSKILKIINEDMENMGKEVLDFISANFDVPPQKFVDLLSQAFHVRVGEAHRARNEGTLKSKPSVKPLDLDKCFEPFKIPLGVISIACVNLFYKVDSEKYRRLPQVQSFLVIMNSFGVYPALVNTIDMVRIIHSCQMRRSLDKYSSPDERFYQDLRDIIVETAIFISGNNHLTGDSSEPREDSEAISLFLQRMGIDMEDKLSSFLSHFFSEHAVAQLEKEHREREQWMVEFESAGRSGSPP